jgi:hypothetical protein
MVQKLYYNTKQDLRYLPIKDQLSVKTYEKSYTLLLRTLA